MITQPAKNLSIQSYVDKNRNSIDEALVSLRVMKQIDDFLEYKNVTNRELAKKLDYTESYVSQLMSGVKKVNVSFINKFEKKFNVEIDFKIKLIEENFKILNSIENQMINLINLNIITINNNSSSFAFNAKSTDFFDYEDAEYVNVEYGN